MLDRIKVPVAAKMSEWEDWRAFNRAGNRYLDQVQAGLDVAAMFRSLVKIVELEPHGYCNRLCRFCGNSTIDRRSALNRMSDEVFGSILNTLETLQFTGQIRFARYSEPLASPTVFPMIEQARLACPDAELMIISNGDFLTREVLSRLSSSGLNRLHVSIYLPAKEKWSVARASHFARKFLKRIGADVNFETYGNSRIEGTVDDPNLFITYNSVDYDEVGVFREGKSQNMSGSFVRHDPCKLVFYNVTIDYDGTMVPCCNVRSDSPNQRNMAYGKIGVDGSLLDIWNNHVALSWRKPLFSFGPQSAPCNTCSQSTVSRPLAPIVKAFWKNAA